MSISMAQENAVPGMSTTASTSVPARQCIGDDEPKSVDTLCQSSPAPPSLRPQQQQRVEQRRVNRCSSPLSFSDLLHIPSVTASRDWKKVAVYNDGHDRSKHVAKPIVGRRQALAVLQQQSNRQQVRRVSGKQVPKWKGIGSATNSSGVVRTHGCYDDDDEEASLDF